jgi:hypothetical protein
MSAPTRIGRYEIIRRIGKSMTEVYLAIDTVENRKTALKLVRIDGDRVQQLVLEAERRGAAIQKELHEIDPRMVEIYEFGDQDGYFFVAMQFVEGRSLTEVLGAEHAMDPIRAAAVALEICEQLAKLHSANSVVHGDIKPSNIHLGPHDTVRLLDFGIAKRLRAGPGGQPYATNHNFGSPGYCSPERLTRSEVEPQSDLWALGATLYEMISGAPPYQAGNTARLESLIRSKRPPRALPARCPRGLRAIVTKALRPYAAQRYGSAGEMQADLQAFLEHKLTLAEKEQRGWSANATIEAARECLRRASRTVGRGRGLWRTAFGAPWARLRAPGAAASFLAGMVLWIGGTLCWQTLEAHRAPSPVRKAAANASAPTAAPAPAPTAASIDLPHLYVQEADRILNSYLASQDNSLDDFDWQKAELCLTHAVQEGASDAAISGDLALSRGYAILERLADSQYSTDARAQQRAEARAQFEAAGRALPLSPAPHLALARLAAYNEGAPERAMAEFAAAEKLGAEPGRREIEQQADAYRLRAERLWSWQDAQKARALYQRIPGFDQADRRLKELDKIHKPWRYKGSSSRRPRWR